jgi:aryl-alcohol dehydrogenase-like predicted oxidoreductase
MVKGAPSDQERAVARAVELGINYFDTAPLYGNGESERNLGRVLKALRPNVIVGTKVRVAASERGRIAAAVTASLEASLQRLGRDHVDLFQLHSAIGGTAEGDTLDATTVLEEVVPAFDKLRHQGKTRFVGITAVGDTQSLHRVVDARAFDTAQVSYNMLNPSAGAPVPAGYPAQDYGELLARTHAAEMGVINIRVLAGGALTGEAARHPLGMPAVAPIGSGGDFGTDVARARRLSALVGEGHAASLVEAALRFAIANAAVSTVLVGYSTQDQLEEAAAAVNKGPLSRAALERLAALQRDFVGEAR